MTELLVNEYWMYKNEPMHLVRFIYKGTKYLIGQEIQESNGVAESRKTRGYSKPTKEIMKEHFGEK